MLVRRRIKTSLLPITMLLPGLFIWDARNSCRLCAFPSNPQWLQNMRWRCEDAEEPQMKSTKSTEEQDYGL